MGGVLTIHSVADLAGLTDRAARWRAISVEADGIEPEASRAWAARLARDYSGCGCAMSRHFGLAGLGGAGLWLWHSGRITEWDWLARSVSAFCMLAAATAIGKMAGSLLASRRLHRTINALAPLLPP